MKFPILKNFVVDEKKNYNNKKYTFISAIFTEILKVKIRNLHQLSIPLNDVILMKQREASEMQDNEHTILYVIYMRFERFIAFKLQTYDK